MSRQSRVFVTQQPKPNSTGWTPNLSPATKFGALHFIFTGSDRPATDPDGAIFIAEEALADFDPISDYILWPNGVDPFSIWAVLLVLAKKGLPQIKGLNWERRLRNGQRNSHDGFYTTVTFRLNRMCGEPEYIMDAVPYLTAVSNIQPSTSTIKGKPVQYARKGSQTFKP